MLVRDPETRANSEARTNGTTVTPNLTNVKDAEEPEDEVNIPNMTLNLPTKKGENLTKNVNK